MPILETTKSNVTAPYLLGLIGEALAGFDVQFMTGLHSSSKRIHQSIPDRFLRWSPDEIRNMFIIDTEDALDEIASEIEKTKNFVDGPWFQRLRFLTFWGRQRFFTNFQSTLCSYWQGVATPYLNRTYAQFCLSLPRAVLEQRRLQADVFRRYYPKVAQIPGTYGGNPLILKGDYMMKRKLAQILPKALCPSSIRSYTTYANPRTWDTNALIDNGYNAIWPINENRASLSEWINISLLDKTYNMALSGDRRAVMKLKAIQPFALHLGESKI